jgi:two-component system NtrC family sensor kinase
VLGWAELMLDDGEADLESVRRIYSGALRARRIVQGLLTFARQAPAEHSWTPVAELTENVLALKAADFRRNNVEVHTNIAAGLPPVWADGGQIQQVLLNLLSNAEHALRPQGGAIWVEVGGGQDALQISVSDSGAGIPEAVLPRIFDPFFTTKPLGQGTGLGLAISHGIVQSHGGSIAVENMVGGGAHFTVTLPTRAGARDQEPQGRGEGTGAGKHELRGAAATERARDALPAPRSVIADPWAAGQRRLLVIDDEPGIRTLLQLQLAGRGYDVAVAHNGAAALALLVHQHFDVLLCDIRMPDMSGQHFYYELARRYPHLTQRIVFLTGDTASGDTSSFFESTGAPVLTKPFLIGELVESLGRVGG